MSKVYKIIDQEDQLTPKEDTQIDWNMCVLCQTSKTDETLQCPRKTLRSDVDVGIGYESLSENIKRFKELGCLPMPLNPKLLEGSGDLAETLKQHDAKWHKNCRNRFDKQKLERAEKRKNTEDSEKETASTSKVTRRSSGGETKTTCDKCFFCGEESGNLHQASTFNLDNRVRRCALELQDRVLLAKLSAGDLISQEAVYHAKCLASLYKRASTLQSDCSMNMKDKRLQGIALAELVTYIEESRVDTDVVPVFKLADLAKMYTSRLKQLGADISGRVHTTDLKNRILANIPDLQAHKQGRDILFVFNEDVGIALKQACGYNFDDEAMTLAQAAKIVRKDILSTNSTFTGAFSETCQQDSIPQSLLTLVGMILGGPNIETQSSNLIETQATLSISQLMMYNYMNHRRDITTSTYHRIHREPPLPIYLGCLVHAKTRKRELVDKLFDLGLSVSYDRVLDLSTDMGNSVCAQFKAEKVVCPPKLRFGLFTTAAVDNIDHNPSSTTAQGALHGTGISMFQHPRDGFSGEAREVATLDTETANKKSIARLPDEYTTVPPVVLPRKDPEVPTTQSPLVSDCKMVPTAYQEEYRWLDHVKNENDKNDSKDMEMSWAAFHASKMHTYQVSSLDTGALLPLFQEQAKSEAMIRHSIDVVSQAVHFLNPGQVPVIACDQPLYAIAKQIQWNWPETYGEKKLVVMFGGLHIELAALKSIGDWLEDSGWTNALAQAKVASSGTADSFLKASHISRTRHAHQVSACALHILIDRAYQCYIQSFDEDTDPLQFDVWRAQREAENPQFQYWSITLKFELAILIYVRSLREGNFNLYKDAISNLVPWFFALDHPNYARWIPVHIRDMMSLDSMHPEVAAEFTKGSFVVRKTQHVFSSIPIDHAHEQNNKCVKGDGGAVGLTENSSQLLRWMVSGPEVARVINEFDSSQEHIKHSQSKGPDIRHHEQVQSVQTTFRNQVKSLCDTMEEMGNPFMEGSEDLLVLDTRDIVDTHVVETVRNIERVGKEQYECFVDERLDKRSKSLFDPIKQNKFSLFSCPPCRTDSKDKKQIASLKQNCSLFSQLYVSCQVRNGDLDTFFEHENQSYPPSISQFGKLRLGCKSDLLVCLENLSPRQEEPPPVDVMILDGAAVINILKPGASKTFEEYSTHVFLPYVKCKLQVANRIDIVWDEYFPDSLKATTRCKRGKGLRRRVQPDTRLPGNWQAFLRVDENKSELFRYLAEQSVTIECDSHQQVISTKGETICCSKPREDVVGLCPCTHEEADSRLLLHVADAANQGYSKVMLRTVDTDVVVIAIATMQSINLTELWIAFGTGKNFRYLSIHAICQSLGPVKSRALPGFHAFTGCDQTSSFATKGKKTAWETWNVYNEVTPAFEVIGCVPTPENIKNVIPLLERFVILMYDRTSTCMQINEARKQLFTRKGRAIDSIPPTADALLQHTKRAAYQAGHCWGQTLQPTPHMPSPGDFGWRRGITHMWEPLWTTLPQASDTCRELLKCGCSVEKGCRGRCKCLRAEMLCTALCRCGGNCDRE